MGLIYKATSPSGKVYIGQTIRTLNKRKSEHKRSVDKNGLSKFDTKFCKALRKYGFDNFKWEILYENIENLNELSKLEESEIQKYNSCKSGYNIEETSIIGGHRSEVTKRKISRTLKAIGHKPILTPEIIKKSKETKRRNWLLKPKIANIKVPKIRVVWNSGDKHQYAKIYYIKTPQGEILEFKLKSSVIEYFKKLSDYLKLNKFKRISGKWLLERGYSQGYVVVDRKRIRETI